MVDNFDIYAYNEEDIEKLERSLNKRDFSGIWCPKKNDRGKCAVCNDAHKLWQMHNETGLSDSKFSEKAKRYGATPQYYMNVVFPDNPSKVFIIQCGKKLINELLSGVRYKGWKAVWHPAAGSTIIVHKKKDGKWNEYSPSPDMNNVKRSLKDLSVLDKLYNLDDIRTLRDSGAALFDIKNMDKTISFDILPGWDSTNPNVFYKEVFYHFNVSEDAIEDGIDDPILNGVDEPVVEQPPQHQRVDTPAPTEQKQEPVKTGPVIHTLEHTPGCFGTYFDPSDKDPEGCNSVSCSAIRSSCEVEFKKKRGAMK